MWRSRRRLVDADADEDVGHLAVAVMINKANNAKGRSLGLKKKNCQQVEGSVASRYAWFSDWNVRENNRQLIQVNIEELKTYVLGFVCACMRGRAFCL